MANFEQGNVSFESRKCQEMSACNFIKKETPTDESSCEFWEIFKNINFVEHFWTAAPVDINIKAFGIKLEKHNLGK